MLRRFRGIIRELGRRISEGRTGVLDVILPSRTSTPIPVDDALQARLLDLDPLGNKLLKRRQWLRDISEGPLDDVILAYNQMIEYDVLVRAPNGAVIRLQIRSPFGQKLSQGEFNTRLGNAVGNELERKGIAIPNLLTNYVRLNMIARRRYITTSLPLA